MADIKEKYVQFDRTHRFAVVNASKGDWLKEDWLAVRVLSETAMWVSGAENAPHLKTQLEFVRFLRERNGGVDQGTVFGNCLVKNLRPGKNASVNDGRKIVFGLQPQPEEHNPDLVLRSGVPVIWKRRFVLTITIPGVLNPAASPRYMVRSFEDRDLFALKKELYTGLVGASEIRRIEAIPPGARVSIPVVVQKRDGPPVALPSFNLNLHPKDFSIACRLYE